MQASRQWELLACKHVQSPGQQADLGTVPARQVQLRALGPGMMQQVQQPCAACGQTGYATPPSDKCGACGGKGLLPEKKVFDVHIAKVRGASAPGAQSLVL